MRSSGFCFRPASRHQRRDRLTLMFCLEARGQVLKHVASLLSAGRHNAQGPLHESTASLAIRTTADPSPDSRKSPRTLRRVVRRLDSLDPRERPQSLFHLENLNLKARRRRLGATAPRTLLQGLADLATQSNHPTLEPHPVQSSVSDPVPVVEQPMGQFQQPLADRLAVTAPIDHRLKIAAKMSPTYLPPWAAIHSEALNRSLPTT